MSHPPRPGEALNQCGSCGNSQTRQSSSYLQGCGVTASFMRWHCLVLAVLTSLSPPSLYSQEIWPSPSRGESWHLQRIASCCLSYGRSQDHLSSLLLTHVAKMKGLSALGILLWGLKLPKIRMRLSARLSAQINIYCLLDAFQVFWLVPLVKLSSFSGFLANIWGWCPDTELLEPELCPAIWVSFDIAPPYPLPLTKYVSLVLVLPWGYWNCLYVCSISRLQTGDLQKNQC